MMQNCTYRQIRYKKAVHFHVKKKTKKKKEKIIINFHIFILISRWGQRGILLTVLGRVFKNEVWRRRINHEFAELYGELSILTVANAGRIRWLGYEDAGLKPP